MLSQFNQLLAKIRLSVLECYSKATVLSTPLGIQTTLSEGSPKTIGKTDICIITYNSSKTAVMNH